MTKLSFSLPYLLTTNVLCHLSYYKLEQTQLIRLRLFAVWVSSLIHISSLCCNLTFHLRNISRIRRYLGFDTCSHVVRSLVLSRMDYGNALLMGAYSKDIARLQRLQNWSAKLIFCARKFDRASHFLKELHWLPISERIQYKIMLYVFKCINGSAPEYISSLLSIHCPVREGLRSSSDTTRLVEHKIHSRTLISASEKTFYFMAPSLWNKLPITIRSSTSISMFKKRLKFHLFNH